VCRQPTALLSPFCHPEPAKDLPERSGGGVLVERRGGRSGERFLPGQALRWLRMTERMTERVTDGRRRSYALPHAVVSSLGRTRRPGRCPGCDKRSRRRRSWQRRASDRGRSHRSRRRRGGRRCRRRRNSLHRGRRPRGSGRTRRRRPDRPGMFRPAVEIAWEWIAPVRPPTNRRERVLHPFSRETSQTTSSRHRSAVHPSLIHLLMRCIDRTAYRPLCP
jgi:hypothetical protein